MLARVQPTCRADAAEHHVDFMILNQLQRSERALLFVATHVIVDNAGHTPHNINYTNNNNNSNNRK